MSGETPEQAAMMAATIAVRKVNAAAKNPRTLLGKGPPTFVAYHAAWAAIHAYTETLDEARRRDRAR